MMCDEQLVCGAGGPCLLMRQACMERLGVASTALCALLGTATMRANARLGVRWQGDSCS